jgi:ABC-2 type transport system permease protein
MSALRVTALFRRVVQELRRDRPSLALLFLAPVLITGLVTFILREGQTPGALLTTRLTTALEAQGATVAEPPDEAAARTLVANGSASIAIVLPANLASGAAPVVTVITRGLDPTGDAGQVTAVQKALLAMASTISHVPLPAIEHATVYGTPSSDPMTNFAPAIVGFFAYFFVYLLTGVSFLRERTGGTLERLMATPVSRGEVVAGYTLGFALFATLQVALLLVWALGTLHVPAVGPLPAFSVGLGISVAGSPILAFLVVLLLAVGAVSLGIFLSTFAHTELQIIQFIPIVLAPQFLLSGVLFPVSSLPAVLQPLVQFMPLNYAVDGLRQVFVRGADLSVSALQADLLILALVAVFFAVVASLTIRRDVV